MNRRGLVVTAVAALAVGWVGGSVYSEDAKPSEADMKAAFEALGRPGPEHQRLKAFVGNWAVDAKMDDGTGKMVDTKGTASFAMVLGDRYLRHEFQGTFDGQPFVGRGIIGFDNATKKWISSWIDSMSTGMAVGEGQETEQGKAWRFKDTFNGPSGPMTMRNELTVVNANELTLVSYMGDATTPMMTMRYRRR
jgi:hypothetical protein